MYTYIYMYIYMCVCVYIYNYIYMYTCISSIMGFLTTLLMDKLNI